MMKVMQEGMCWLSYSVSKEPIAHELLSSLLSSCLSTCLMVHSLRCTIVHVQCAMCMCHIYIILINMYLLQCDGLYTIEQRVPKKGVKMCN